MKVLGQDRISTFGQRSPATPDSGPEPETPKPGETPDALDARIFEALARRDRARLASAAAELARLQARVAALERIGLQRGVAVARRMASALPPWAKAAIRRSLRGRPAVPSPASEAAPPLVALVIDDHWPQADRDSGSVDTVNLLRSLQALGYEVHFVGARESGAPSPALDALVRSGVRPWAPPPPNPGEADPVEGFLARLGPSVDLCVLSRVYCGGRYLEAAQRSCTKARLLFNTVDLHWVREERRARVGNDPKLLAAAGELRRREEHLARACDATVVVSRTELDLLAGIVPEALVVELPLARPLAPPRAPFAARRGIGFIGGFLHAPNQDAVRYFLDEVWPLLLRDLPDAELTIVGADFPAGLLDGRPGRVRALGHLRDVGPWWESLRVSVAPLRFGAGAKGKVASSLAAGVPCVATPVAAEGMGLDICPGRGSGVLVAADPAAFASCILEAHEDAAAWERLSAGGLAYARETLSPDAWQERLAATLGRIGLPRAAGVAD